MQDYETACRAKNITCILIDAFVDNGGKTFADSIRRIIRVIFYFFMTVGVAGTRA